MDSDRNYNPLRGFSRGASLLEYAIVTAILVAVFVVVADRLFSAVSYRGNESANTVRDAVPCRAGGPLTGEACL